MTCPSPNQLMVDPKSSSLQPHSAPESRRSSWLEESGQQRLKERVEGQCTTSSTRASSLPNCSSIASPNPQPTPTPGGPSSGSALPSEGSKCLPQPDALQDRPSSPSFPRTPPYTPSSLPSSSSSSPCPRWPLTFLRHHTSLDSAALACEFFGHKSSGTSSLPSRSRPRIQRAQTSLHEEDSMISSPLLRRPHVMGASALHSPLGLNLILHQQQQQQQQQPHSPAGGGSPSGQTSPMSQAYTPSPRRRLTITLPCSLPVSPVACRAQRTDSSTSRSPQGRSPQARSPQGRSPQGKSPSGWPPQGRSPSLESNSSGEPSSPSSYFRVVVLGDERVGKTTLIRQMTLLKGATCSLPQERAGQTTDGEDNDWLTQRVVVKIERREEHCALEIFDNPLDANIDHLRPDAFIVIYSVSDRKSYLTAKEVTRHLRCELGMDRPVFLVGNKIDLRRQQRVTSREARDVAEAYDCCVLETSAALRINVDSLLLQVLDRILQQLAPPGQWSAHGQTGRQGQPREDAKTWSSSPGRAARFFSKILRRAFLRRSVSSEALGLCLH